MKNNKYHSQPTFTTSRPKPGVEYEEGFLAIVAPELMGPLAETLKRDGWDVDILATPEPRKED